ncbi:MAG: putative NADPH-quinone reductase [Gammaproteobacteria bacterium]|jgi:putative NADPH-quinone reductase
MPALLKAFFEQTFLPEFVFEANSKRWPKQCLGGRSARIVITMGMPVFIYWWYFGAHILKSLERDILKVDGIRPIKEVLFGMVEAAINEKRQRWLKKMRSYGERGIKFADAA